MYHGAVNGLLRSRAKSARLQKNSTPDVRGELPESVPERHRILAASGHVGCNAFPKSSWEQALVHNLAVALFAATCGFTASGITANLYRLMAKKPENLRGKTIYFVIMVIAGPSVLFENAAKKLRAKTCSTYAFLLAAAISGYWSFVIGLLVLNISLAV
jgi:hypothetical protein